MQPWKTLSRRVESRPNRFLTLEVHEVQVPDGRTIPDWPWLVLPDYANVLAETAEGKFIVFRQRKYALEGISLAPAGGYLEPGEDPLVAARRELREETGYEAPEWYALGNYVVDANRGAGRAHLFLARGAVRVCEPVGEEWEEQQILFLSRAEVEEALARGEFQVLAWATVVALGLRQIANLEAPLQKPAVAEAVGSE